MFNWERTPPPPPSGDGQDLCLQEFKCLEAAAAVELKLEKTV